MQQLKYKSKRRLLQTFAILTFVLGSIGIANAQSASQATAGQDKPDEFKSIFDGTLNGSPQRSLRFQLAKDRCPPTSR